MDFIHSVLCNDYCSGSPIDIVNCREGEGEEGKRDNSSIFFFTSLEFLVLVPNFRAGRHLPYLWKNGERKRYHPRG